MTTRVHRQALEDLKTIARHMHDLAHGEIGENDVVKIKTLIRLWNAKAYQAQRDAIINIEVLFDAIEHGIDLSELVDYEDFVAWRDEQRQEIKTG